VRTGSKVDFLELENEQHYHGEIKNGIPHGFGILADSAGSIYEGGFIEGEKSGRGRLTYSNGDQYVGEFVRN
jgi:hypothetical protein